MTSKTALLSIVVAILLFSCQQAENTDTTTPTELLINTSESQMQPVVLAAPADLRLSYTGRTVTDSSVFYQVMATYKGEEIGFHLSVPRGGEGTAYFSGIGTASDSFLRFLDRLYGRQDDTAVRFREYVSAHFLPLGILGSDSVSQRPGTQNKLVFRNVTTGDSAELYLDINEKEHWIGLAEKDTLYRPRLIKALGKHSFPD